MKIKKFIPVIAGVVLGGLAGYIYWYKVGCLGGSCPIYSVWYKSTFYGMLLGGLLGSLVQDLFKTKPKSTEANNI